MLGNFHAFFMSADLIFFKITFFKKFFQENYQIVGLWVLIWVQSFAKLYQQMTRVASSNERVKDKYGQIFTFSKQAKMNRKIFTAVQNLMNYRTMIDSLLSSLAFKQ